MPGESQSFAPDILPCSDGGCNGQQPCLLAGFASHNDNDARWASQRGKQNFCQQISSVPACFRLFPCLPAWFFRHEQMKGWETLRVFVTALLSRRRRRLDFLSPARTHAPRVILSFREMAATSQVAGKTSFARGNDTRLFASLPELIKSEVT